MSNSAFTEEQRAEIRRMMKEYIQENLTVSVSTQESYEYSSKYLGVTVEISLEGEVISSYHDSAYLS